ncbi:MAG: hypothetical protein PHF00_02425 [Elusimicrobia bacterium]|nr:hypothetical protein [Elusimicrobiota bacterium]
MLPSNKIPIAFHFIHRNPWLRPFLAGVLAGVLVASIPWEAVFMYAAGRVAAYRERRDERRRLAPLAHEARRLALSYEAVSSDPQKHLGQPVLWCVDHPGRGSSCLAGRPAQSLSWANEDAVPVTTPVNGGSCVRVVASVEGAGASGVRLVFIGEP